VSTLAGDFWVCGDCRSINNAGARQCYNCRTPRDRAAVDNVLVSGTAVVTGVDVQLVRDPRRVIFLAVIHGL